MTAAALMVVPAHAGAVSFFRGDFPVGTNPISVAVANFNGGPLDLAVANEGSDNVSILLGNGLGQFTASTPVSAGTTPSSIVTGSFNGDAFTDLAIANVGTTDDVVVRLGDGTGAFTNGGTVATTDPRALATGDMNGDSVPDLVAANTSTSTVSVLLGNGTGGFAGDATPFDVAATAANPVSIAVGNFENPTPDLDLDAVITSLAADQVLTITGNGTDGFNGSGTNYTAMFSATNPNPSGVAIGSLNPNSPIPANAAEPDMLVANETPDHLLPGFGSTAGIGFGFGTALPTGADPVGVAFGDLDGDGDPDGISANSGAATATVILSDGTGGTSTDSSSAVGTTPKAVATGAFDADGKADAAVANYASNSVTVLTSLQPGPIVTPPTTTIPAPIQTPVTPPKKCKKKKGKKGALAAKKCKKKRK